MSVTYKKFYVELYQEYLSEASFLYEQRLSLLDDPEISWKDIDDFEQRFEAHIDGLVVGEELALDVCKQQAVEGDFGELNAAVRVFCRQNRIDLFKEIVNTIDPEDQAFTKAVSDALKDELPVKWIEELIYLMDGNHPVLIRVFPEVIGYRRINLTEKFMELLQKNEINNIQNLLWALGRIRNDKIRVSLFNIYLKQEDESINSAAALALLRIGEAKVISYCQRILHQQSWASLLLGLSGNRFIVPDLIEIASSGNVNTDCLTSLGLLGDISAIEILLYHINNKELAKSSIQALNLITGAELYEDVFVPEAIDEDELFEEEKEKLKAGEPIYPAGKEPGTTLHMLSQEPVVWIDWWKSNKSKFNPKIRYRNGKPYSPVCLIENMEAQNSPRKIRDLAYEELVIRYNVDFPFETDMPVINQMQSIEKFKQWILNTQIQLQSQWYFAGKPQ